MSNNLTGTNPSMSDVPEDAKHLPSGRGVLTEADVRAIRASREPLRDLAERYGIHVSAVSNIINRGTYRHIAPSPDDAPHPRSSGWNPKPPAPPKPPREPRTDLYYRPGTENPNTVLSEADVLAIYHSTGPRQDVAERYGIHVNTVSMIRHGRRWAWLTKHRAA